MNIIFTLLYLIGCVHVHNIVEPSNDHRAKSDLLGNAESDQLNPLQQPIMTPQPESVISGWTTIYPRSMPFRAGMLMITDEIKYLIPNSDGDKLTVKLTNLNVNTAAVFTLNYWVSDGTHIAIKDSKAVNGITLWKTTTKDDSGVEWAEETFYLSDFVPDLNGRHEVSLELTGNFEQFSSGNGVIAVKTVEIQFCEVDKTTRDLALNYFVDSDDNSGHQVWQEFPKMSRFTVSSNPLNFTFKPTQNKGMAYIYSDWFKVDGTKSDMVLYYTLTHSTGSENHINVTAMIIAEDFSTVVQQKATIKRRPLVLFVSNLDNHLLRVSFVISYDGHVGPNDASITLSQISLGDGCDSRYKPCSNHGECARTGPSAYKCSCRSPKRGDDCELDDYCETLPIKVDGKDIKGTDLCTRGGAKCVSHEDKNLYPAFHCECGDRQFWDPTKNTCRPFNECSRVKYCKEPTACVDTTEKPFDLANPCAGCQEGFILNGTECIKTNPCEVCEDMLCQLLKPNLFDYGILCYCPVGFKSAITFNEKDQPRKTCTPKITSKCPEIVRTAHGCEQTCDWEPPFFGKEQVTCTCFNGWSMNNVTNKCQKSSTFECQDQLDNDGLCVLGQGDKPEWRCKAGFYQSDKNLCMVDFCEKAQNDEQLREEIQTICGQSIDTCTTRMDSKKRIRFFCDCEAKGFQLDEITGRCVLDDLCVKGGSLDMKCQNDGMVCRRNVMKNGQFMPSFKCDCRAGEELDEELNRCVEQCKLRRNILGCLVQNKVCEVNYLGRQPNCVCQHGFMEKKMSGGGDRTTCKLSMFAYKSPKITFSLSANVYRNIIRPIAHHYLPEVSKFKLFLDIPAHQSRFDQLVKSCESSPDPIGCFIFVEHLLRDEINEREYQDQNEMQIVKNELKLAVEVALNGHQDYDTDGFSLIHFQKVDKNSNLYITQLSLSFNKSAIRNSWMKRLVSRCQEIKAIDEGHCILPPGIIIEEMSIIDVGHAKESQILEPCNEHHIKYCPASSTCHPVPGFRNSTFAFQCTCDQPGFTVEHVVNMGSQYDDTLELRKEICVDIDECNLPENDRRSCPSNSTCYNTVGWRRCECDDGFKMVNARATFREQCIGVCNGIKCYNGGSCHVQERAKNDYVCKCENGWIGNQCDTEDPKVIRLRVSLISVCVGLGTLLVIIIIALLIVLKRNHAISSNTGVQLRPNSVWAHKETHF